MSRLARIIVVLAALVAAPFAVGPSSAEPQHAGSHGNVLAKKVIGTSVRGRPIVAWHLDDRPVDGRSGPTVLLIATMHGNEGAPRQILDALRTARAIHGVDLWLVPTYNPDGLAAHTRRNAHGVDLNRNYPYHWVDLDGNYESGPHPASEPETRAMMKLLNQVRPDYVLSFHQPLHGVDTDTKRPKFSRRVAHYLHLPVKTLSCGGVCHGTMTGWYNHNFDGLALTIEYGAHPPKRLMQQVAPRQVLRIFGAFGSFGGR